MTLRIHVSSVSVVFVLPCSVTTHHHVPVSIQCRPGCPLEPTHALAGLLLQNVQSSFEASLFNKTCSSKPC